ncbi:fused MFS/spermidine synthase [Hydrogenophaga sp.]|uniref:fused MFS/spermidine synthase n=1 Tax=Hydrogenophaga sp. TaxID=1904254 RepID=UPI0025C70B37|nr:fused MFS/spermidine synthase [Hydrogenophaga sp.]
MSFNFGSALQNALIHAGLNVRDVRIQHKRFEQALSFGLTDVQSAMDPRQPDRLVLNYTRVMMGFLVFSPQPRNMLMIGLGGGSLPKFCHRHCPGTDITVVEIDPRVIALRDQFEVPPDQNHFRVLQADGADFVAAMDDASYDIIMVDGFDAESMAPSLGTQNFYGLCARLLTTGGVMVCNLHELDLHFGAYLERIALSFDGEAVVVAAREPGNSVVFARKDVAVNARMPKHLQRPAGMSEEAWAGIESEVHDVLREARSLRAFS